MNVRLAGQLAGEESRARRLERRESDMSRTALSIMFWRALDGAAVVVGEPGGSAGGGEDGGHAVG